MHRSIFALPFFVVATAMAEPVFQGLGFAGLMSSLSADATQISGAFYPPENNANTTAYLWNATTGVQTLGLFSGSSLSAGSSYTQAIGMNAHTVVGYGRTDNASDTVAFRWDSGIGYTQLSTPAGFSMASATTLSADSSAVFGYSYQYSGNIHAEATRWTSAGVARLGILPGFSSSFIHDVSADGTVAVGGSGGPSGSFIWTQASGLQPIPGMAGAISADGAYVVGATNNYPNGRAYRWSATTGMLELGVLSPTHAGSIATDVSADGGIVVGYSYGDIDRVPFIWSSATGMLDLRDVIAANGGNLIGWSLYASGGVLRVADDGLTVAGNGVGPNNFNEAWIAHLTTTIPEPAATGRLIACMAGAFVALRRGPQRRKFPRPVQ